MNWSPSNCTQPCFITDKCNESGRRAGGLGFTIYDEKDNELYKRDVRKFSWSAGETIPVSGTINKIKFSSSSEAFYDQFEVHYPDGCLQQLECTGCESTSTSLTLGNLYLDSDQVEEDPRYNPPYTPVFNELMRNTKSNCRDNCEFKLKGRRKY